MLSRQKFLFALDETQKIQSPSYTLEGPCAPISELCSLHSIFTSRAFRIYKTFGEESIEKVTEDPYCLAREVRGIGFKTADQIAGTLGISKESELRARAGIEYVLQELTNEGHCG